MSYRLISSNDIAIKYPEVNDMPCIYADLPNGMDGEHYVLKQEPSGDLISRDELLRAIDTWDKFGVDDTNSLFRLDNLSLPHYVPYIHYDDLVKCIKGMPSGNPVLSGDLISRQAVLNTLDRMDKALDTDRTVESYKELLTECYKVLPPVKQEPKTDDMTSSHSELDIYKGCIDLMNDLLRQVYEWLEIVGIDVSEMDEDEQFATHFYTTEIVERLFLWKTSHSGGTSQRMKLKELGITDDAVLFDFAKMVEPQERSDKE